MEEKPKTNLAEVKPGYSEQLRQAQKNLLEYNDKINQLLNQIDSVKEMEEKHQQVLKTNEELSGRVEELQKRLLQKENEFLTVKKKEQLTSEMTSMIENAYIEFNVLQEKMQKLENQVHDSREINLEYENLKEENYKLFRDLEQQREKYNITIAANQQFQALLAETEDKLKEAIFQRQQLQKKVSYLQELNSDMQVIADANKKLESQLKRIGELESMLNVMSEEKDQLSRRQINP